MKLLYSLIIFFSACTIAAAQTLPPPAEVKIEITDGQTLYIRDFNVANIGDSLVISMKDLRLEEGSAVTRFNVPGNVVASIQPFTHTRGNINPNDYAGVISVQGDMRESDGELLVEIEIRVEREAVNNRQGLTIIPELYGDDDCMTFHGVMLTGKQRGKLYDRAISFMQDEVLENLPGHRLHITILTDTLVKYNLRLPYEMWMDDATMRVHYVLTSPTRKEQLITQNNAGRVKLEPRVPYEVQPLVSRYIPEKTDKNRRMEGQAYLDFAVGRSVLVPTFRRNPEELAKIDAIMQTVLEDKDITLNSITLTGYASPEGSYANNDRLSRSRAEALRDYIRQKFAVDQSLFTVNNVAEDWEGLREMLEASSMTSKQRVLSIIDEVDIFATPGREAVLMRLDGGRPWRQMLTEMFPDLRRTEYRADFTVRQYTLEEAKDIATRKPENLSLYELYLLAQSYDSGSVELSDINEIMIRQNPDDPTAILNYAAWLLSQGDTQRAKRMLDRVADDERAVSNIGIYYLLTGDLDKAQEYLERSLSRGDANAAHNLEELRLKRDNNALMERYKR